MCFIIAYGVLKQAKIEVIKYADPKVYAIKSKKYNLQHMVHPSHSSDGLKSDGLPQSDMYDDGS